MSEIDDLSKAVEDIKAAVTGAVTKIQELSATITANAADPAAMENAAQQLEALATQLNSAVTPPQA